LSESAGNQSDGDAPADRPVRVVIVDDHPVVRFGLISLLNAQPDIEVVGEAESREDCLAVARDAMPDVLILDLEMGEGGGGLEAIADLQRLGGVRIVVYTSHDNDWTVTRTLQTGVQGFVCKGTPAETLVEAVHAVMRGQVYLDPAIAGKVVGTLGRSQDRRRVDRSLTERELEVLRKAAEGLRNKEISRELGISERTVKFHMSALMGKLGVSNRTEAVRVGMQKGLYDDTGSGASDPTKRRRRDRAHAHDSTALGPGEPRQH
jgi:DNA-binding NarL/FixJ family response regulator